MTGLLTSMSTALMLAALLAPPQAIHAQRMAPTAFTRASVEVTRAANGKFGLQNSLLSESSRSRHVATGVFIGAAAGGIFGAIAYSRDHSGDGFVAPVVIGAGVVAGLLVGALVGALWPTR